MQPSEGACFSTSCANLSRTHSIRILPFSSDLMQHLTENNRSSTENSIFVKRNLSHNGIRHVEGSNGFNNGDFRRRSWLVLLCTLNVVLQVFLRCVLLFFFIASTRPCF